MTRHSKLCKVSRARDSDKDEEVLQCTSCPKTFKRKTHLKRHQQSGKCSKFKAIPGKKLILCKTIKVISKNKVHHRDQTEKCSISMWDKKR
jgi:hypothetical protein